MTENRGHRTTADSLKKKKEKKKKDKKVLQVILKVLKTGVNCFDLPTDKCIAVIAVDRQGQFVKNSNNGQVRFRSSSALQSLLRGMQMLVRQSKYLLTYPFLP